VIEAGDAGGEPASPTIKRNDVMVWTKALWTGFATLSLGASDAVAQDANSFFRGKSIAMVIGFGPGASNDFYGRLVARHLGKHIPGTPTIVPQNMPGAGSFKAANYLFHVAPKDGTAIGIVTQTLATEEALGASGIKFKSAEFTWLGRVTSDSVVTFMWETSKIKTIADAMKQEAPIGATGVSSTVTIYPLVLNAIVGTKLKVVLGYQSSTAAMLAMEKGEVEGASTGWGTMKITKQEWLRDKKVNIIVQYGPERHPDLPDVPTAVELGKTDEDRQVLGLYANDASIGKSILAPPKVPADRTTVLRAAFDAMVKDPEFLDEVKQANAEFDPLSGEKLQAVVEKAAQTPESVRARARAIHPSKSK
jgi:tripartite-type tricarboxylate transporter receptor subunit TctC